MMDKRIVLGRAEAHVLYESVKARNKKRGLIIAEVRRRRVICFLKLKDYEGWNASDALLASNCSV
jgi:hypothetical protein